MWEICEAFLFYSSIYSFFLLKSLLQETSISFVVSKIIFENTIESLSSHFIISDLKKLFNT